MNRELSWALAAWVFLAVACFGVFAVASGIPRIVRLKASSDHVLGVVSDAPPRSHGTVRVEYTVNGTRYSQSFAPYTHKTGDRVTVFYDRRDPNISILDFPAERLSQLLPACFAAALLLPTAMTFLLVATGKLRGASPRLTPPRVTAVLVCMGALVSRVVLLSTRDITPGRVAGSVLVACGCLALLALCRKESLSWRALAERKGFWLALACILAGGLLT
jgi:hypothetical protein